MIPRDSSIQINTRVLTMRLRTNLLALALPASFCMAVGLQAQNLETPAVDHKPAQLQLTRLDDKVALISAAFPSEQKRSKALTFSFGKTLVSLVDDGSQGDVRAGDGIFSAKIEFDFDAFAKSNAQLLDKNAAEKSPVFAPGNRQQLGIQHLAIGADSARLITINGNKEQSFVLPFDASLIRIDQTIELPLVSLPMGIPLDTAPVSRSVSVPRSLMITDVSVVNDPSRTWACNGTNTSPVGNPTGDWTFWRLMENIANGTSSTSDYIKRLFRHWANNQVVNGFNVAARPLVYQEVIRNWEIRSGGVGADLLPDKSPFRLLGIVLRADLRGGTGPYAGGDAGEGRFVFALHDGNCNNRSKTIILEYKVPITGCTNIRDWARKWIDLASSANYNQDLNSLTQVFAAAGANPFGPNQSAIGQVRTNELLPGSPHWEMREFVLPDSGGNLIETTVKQEPHIGFNNSATLANYLNLNWPSLVGPPSGQHIVPDEFPVPGSPFLAGSSPVVGMWSAPSGALTIPTSPAPVTPPPATIRDDALFEFALNTCSGCHLMETSTPFAHLDYNSIPGMPAFLSGFLTGISIPDPRNPAVMRHFNDLARRAADLSVAANMSCSRVVAPGNLVLQQLTSPAVLRAVH
ncbi:hypothetical protein CJA_2851 [Cellvibrio japonicus Ueda107]|uniref:Lipoprotein n=2 Tax=Cellvibrio japonicus TaxID=155077 RepID=B3PC38_CELJU|nr:hypothetical protein CJA_2851 [Cellvibrio japonicus Ueda107]